MFRTLRLLGCVLCLLTSACDDRVAERDALLDSAGHDSADSAQAPDTLDTSTPSDTETRDTATDVAVSDILPDDTAVTDTASTPDSTDAVDSAPDVVSTCNEVDPNGFGDCRAVLGVGYDGTTCVAISGCDCGEACEQLFPTLDACAAGCSEAGVCNDETLLGTALNQGQVVRAGTLCDGVGLCADADEEQALREVFADVNCEVAPDADCLHGRRCALYGNLVLSAEQATLLCRLSLSSSDLITCPVYGP